MELPLVTSFYGLDLSSLAERPRFASGYARLFAQGTLFLCEGPAMARTLEGLGCPKERIRRQTLAIDLERFAFRVPEAPRRGDPVRLLQIASLREKKGHRYLLEACAELARRGLAFELRLIGNGPLRSELEQLTRELGLEEQVRFLGALSHTDCAEHLAAADLFVHPSVLAKDGDREGGAPTILLEAQARGLPIVGTTHDDIPFYVRDGESGVLVAERDAAALADALHELATHPERWPEMARAGRGHVEGQFAREWSLALLRSNYAEAGALHAQAPRV